MSYSDGHIHQGIPDAEAVRPDFALFKVALDCLGEAVILTEARLDRPGPVIRYVNPAFCRMTGYSAEEVLGQTPRILQGPSTDRAVLARLRSDLETRESFQATAVNYRKDGTPYRFHWHITPLRNQDGELTHWVALQREIEPDAATGEGFEQGMQRVREMTRQAASRLAATAAPSGDTCRVDDHGAPDFGAVQGQVRDILASVRSIARRTADTHDSAEDYVMHFDGRIGALARVKTAMVQTGGYRLELGWLVSQELLAFDAPGEHRVTIEGPTIDLRPRTAELIGLGIHELATNALKFGALSEAAGTVTVSWRLVSRGGVRDLVLVWSESGMAEPVRRPSKTGFGLNYLEQIMPRDLGATATLGFASGGLVYTLRVPLSGKPDHDC